MPSSKPSRIDPLEPSHPIRLEKTHDPRRIRNRPGVLVDAVVLPVFHLDLDVDRHLRRHLPQSGSSGWGKALWSIFIIVLPYLGVFVYLIARGNKMQQHSIEAAQAQDAAMRQYVQASRLTTQRIGRRDCSTGALRDQGVLSEAEFQQAKTKALS